MIDPVLLRICLDSAPSHTILAELTAADFDVDLPHQLELSSKPALAQSVLSWFDPAGLDVEALRAAACISGNLAYLQLLADPQVADEAVEVFRGWYSLKNLAIRARPVLASVCTGNPSMSYLLNLFKVRATKRWFQRTPTHWYLMPHLVARGYQGFLQPQPLDALFSTQEEASTTLGLWCPGSDDVWASFEYAHATACAL